MTDIHSEALDREIEDEGQRIFRDRLMPGDAVVVTGAARGFGRAIARRLARDGARLAIWDIVEEDGQRTVDLCREAGAKDATFFACDMGDAAKIASAAAAVREKFGTIYAVVNNAGIHPRSPALTVPLEMWNRTLAVNLTGSFLTAQAFAPSMIEAGRGAVINLASGRAIQGAKMGIHYAASKAGIIAMTKTLAQEWAEYGIRVNAIIPGVSETRQPLEASGVTLESLRERGKGHEY